MSKFTKALLVIVLMCSVGVGAHLGYQRILLEDANKTIEIAVDYRDIQRIALLDKISEAEVLATLQNAGVTSIGLPEDTLITAQEAGNLIWAPGYELNRLGDKVKSYFPFVNFTPKAYLNYVVTFNQNVLKRLQQELSSLLGADKLTSKNHTTSIDHFTGELKELGIGMDQNLVEYLDEQRFYIIPRLANNKNYNEKSIHEKFHHLKNSGRFDYIIFEKEEVIGYPNNIAQTAKALKDYKLKFGLVEFSKQKGDRALAKLMGDQMLKVHSIPEDEILEMKITKDKAVARFSRAVRERGVRLLYVHPFFNVDPRGSYLKYNEHFVKEIWAEIDGLGYSIGQASHVTPLRVELWQLFVLGFGVFVFSVALVWYFSDMYDWFVYVLAVTFAVLMFAGIQTIGFLALQKLLAALAAVVVPTYAIISNFEREPKGYKLRRALSIVMHCVTDTALGIILIIGLLADSRFMSGAELFKGVKIVLVVPILIVIAYFFYKDEYGTNLWDKFKKFLQIRVPVSYMFWGAVLTMAAGILLARSGNFILPVLGFEKNFRVILEQIFFARPRMKEFLIGYPFLFFAASYCLNHHKRWLWFLLAVGTIGLTSLTNTFCHIHTPIMFSILRSVNGLIIGLIIGVIVNGIYLRVKRIKK